MAEYCGCIIDYWASGASIYRRTGGILECKTRHEESYLYPKLPHTYIPNISLTLIRLASFFSSLVINLQARDKGLISPALWERDLWSVAALFLKKSKSAYYF
jgi:hypothetical protein